MSSSDDRPDEPAVEAETTSATDTDESPHFEGVAKPHQAEPQPHWGGTLKPPPVFGWFGLRLSRRGRNER